MTELLGSKVRLADTRVLGGVERSVCRIGRGLLLLLLGGGRGSHRRIVRVDHAVKKSRKVGLLLLLLRLRVRKGGHLRFSGCDGRC